MLSDFLLINNSLFNLLVFLYFAFFVVLTWKNFRFAIALFIILMPSYLIRFSIGGVVSTILEMTFLSIFFVWVIRHSRHDWQEIKKFVYGHKILFIAILFFFVVSFFYHFERGSLLGVTYSWRAFFLEPVLLFFMLVGRGEDIKGADIICFLAYSTIPISALALAQKFLDWLFPVSFWHFPPDRVTSFFQPSGAVGLYLGPIIILMGALLIKKIKLRHLLEEEEKIVSPSLWSLPDRKLWQGIKGGTVILCAAFAMATAAVIFSFSRSALAAIGLGSVIFALLVGWRKTALIIAAFGALLYFFAPSMRIDALFFKPSSAMILDFFVQTSFVGFLSFILLVAGAIIVINRRRKNDDITLGAGAIGALCVIIVFGLLDNPYFKNDLAMEFWILMTFVANSKWISDFTIWTSVNKIMWRKSQPPKVPALKEPHWMNG